MDVFGVTGRSDVLLECVGGGSAWGRLLHSGAVYRSAVKTMKAYFTCWKWAYLGICEYCTAEGMRGWGGEEESGSVK